MSSLKNFLVKIAVLRQILNCFFYADENKRIMEVEIIKQDQISPRFLLREKATSNNVTLYTNTHVTFLAQKSLHLIKNRIIKRYPGFVNNSN